MHHGDFHHSLLSKSELNLHEFKISRYGEFYSNKRRSVRGCR